MDPISSDSISIQLLSRQQEHITKDIAEINTALSKVAETLSSLAVLEQKHTDSLEAIRRAHGRIDLLEFTIKDEVKGHEKRIQNLEIHDAKNVWIERLFMVAVAAIISLWVKGTI